MSARDGDAQSLTSELNETFNYYQLATQTLHTALSTYILYTNKVNHTVICKM